MICFTNSNILLGDTIYCAYIWVSQRILCVKQSFSVLSCCICLTFPCQAEIMSSHVCLTDTNCPDKPIFTPTKVVVKYGNPFSANCSVCQHACFRNSTTGLEKALGVYTQNGSDISWMVASMTEWDTFALCYYEDIPNHQCCTSLNITVYRK